MGIEASLGFAERLGDADSGYDIGQRGGPVVGGGVFFAPSRAFDLGFTFEHAAIGEEEAPPAGSVSTARVTRSLNTVWANVRAYPWRSDRIGLFVGLMFGPSWERSHADGAVAPNTISGTVTTYKCDVSGSTAFALGAQVGTDYDLGDGVALLLRASASTHATGSDFLSDDVGACMPGVGTVAAIDAQLGFAYRFDLNLAERSTLAKSF